VTVQSPNQQTLGYYSANAQEYARVSSQIDMSATRQAFQALLPQDAHILDAGCGSGRDTAAFLRAGFQVTAFDGCAEMAAQASQFAKHPVQTLLLQEVSYQSCFDGIWASGSLLHLETAELTTSLARLFRALKPAGILYSLFKEGEGERFDEKGRFFNDMTLPRAQALIEDAGGTLVSSCIEDDAMGRDVRWIRLIACRGQ
jgi:SAM-dependent methyltransferase